MATLKDVKNKIGAVKKTKQITKAMNMVAASRLRGAQAVMNAFRPYAEKLSEVLGGLVGKDGENQNPLLTPREAVANIHLVLCTSDRGLCGGFNANLIAKTEKFMSGKIAPDQRVTFTCFGRKGRDWCRKRNLPIAGAHIGIIGGRFGFNVAAIAGRKLVDEFISGVYDEVYVIYSEFVGMARQTPVVKKILPIPPVESAAKASAADAKLPYLPEHIWEPSPEKLLSDLLPRNVSVQIHRALLETSTSEHAARMSAMDNATNACNDMITSLTLAYNKARQAAITADLMDIVGGAEALKG